MNYISIMASEKMDPPNSLLTNSAAYPIVCFIRSNPFASDKRRALCAVFNYGKLHLLSIVSIRNKTNKEKPWRRGVCITPCQRGRCSGGRDEAFPGKLRGRPKEGIQKVASEPGIRKSRFYDRFVTWVTETLHKELWKTLRKELSKTLPYAGVWYGIGQKTGLR